MKLNGTKTGYEKDLNKIGCIGSKIQSYKLYLLAGSGTFLLLAFKTLQWGNRYFLRQKVQTGMVAVWAIRYTIRHSSRKPLTFAPQLINKWICWKSFDDTMFYNVPAFSGLIISQEHDVLSCIDVLCNWQMLNPKWNIYLSISWIIMFCILIYILHTCILYR